MLNRTSFPSDSMTWQDVFATIPANVPASTECCYLCGQPARIMSVVDYDGRTCDVFACSESHVDEDSDVAANVAVLWTGADWEAWENIVDFPELVR